jgi:hypothetical protein
MEIPVVSAEQQLGEERLGAAAQRW